MRLDALVTRAAAATPDALAVRAPDGDFTYAQLDALANQIAHVLSENGVGPGDRVGIWLPKSARAIAAMQGVLRIGAAYVPVDATGPASRARTILSDCAVRAIVADEDAAGAILMHDDLRHVPLVTADAIAGRSVDALPPPAQGSDALAYILYTSGSTGRPKGVCISHENALAFVRWGVRAFAVASHRERAPRRITGKKA